MVVDPGARHRRQRVSPARRTTDRPHRARVAPYAHAHPPPRDAPVGSRAPRSPRPHSPRRPAPPSGPGSVRRDRPSCPADYRRNVPPCRHQNWRVNRLAQLRSRSRVLPAKPWCDWQANAVRLSADIGRAVTDVERRPSRRRIHRTLRPMPPASRAQLVTRRSSPTGRPRPGRPRRGARNAPDRRCRPGLPLDTDLTATSNNSGCSHDAWNPPSEHTWGISMSASTTRFRLVSHSIPIAQIRRNWGLYEGRLGSTSSSRMAT
jgi:hypothetical protein